jgi:hypothetical protein
LIVADGCWAYAALAGWHRDVLKVTTHIFLISAASQRSIAPTRAGGGSIPAAT